MRAALAFAAALAGGAASAAPAACKLALVLALDVSSSVNSREYAIQRDGLAAAFRRPEVIEAILAPGDAAIAVTAFEWSGAGHQAAIAPWTLLDSEAAIRAFADRIAAHQRTATSLSTGLGAALAHAAGRFRTAPACDRRTIDVSGDGANNDGPEPGHYRALGLFDGITINGLAIQGAYPDPAIYYTVEVMHGPGAFVALARDFLDYPPVIVGKLLREIDAPMIVGRAGVR